MTYDFNLKRLLLGVAKEEKSRFGGPNVTVEA